MCQETEEFHEEKQETTWEDLTIQSAILNLIHYSLETSFGVSESYSASLKEALSLFNLLNNSLDNSAKFDLSYGHLKVMKVLNKS